MDYAKMKFSDISWFKENRNKKFKMFNDMNYKNQQFRAVHCIDVFGVKEELCVKVKTDYDATFQKLIGEIFYIHSILKSCRNIFNHGKATEKVEKSGKSNQKKNGGRPSIEDIDAVIKKYIANVKRL